MKKSWLRILISILVFTCVVFGWFVKNQNATESISSLKDIPSFSGSPYVVINDNTPSFTDEQLVTKSYEFYSELDTLGRCGYAVACIGKELMPTEDRGSIGPVRPSGWQTIKFDFVDGKYLYNRCHLIGFQLTGENANEKNLITGTRYLNVEGMLPFENMVADYIKETKNHVIYRVTPIYEGDDLVAKGVQMEALSVEDGGEGICFNIYAYNNQPGVSINYANGSAQLAETETITEPSEKETGYILNIKSKKFHAMSCEQGKDILSDNRENYVGSRQSLIDSGYTPAGCCEP